MASRRHKAYDCLVGIIWSMWPGLKSNIHLCLLGNKLLCSRAVLAGTTLGALDGGGGVPMSHVEFKK